MPNVLGRGGVNSILRHGSAAARLRVFRAVRAGMSVSKAWKTNPSDPCGTGSVRRRTFFRALCPKTWIVPLVGIKQPRDQAEQRSFGAAAGPGHQQHFSTQDIEIDSCPRPPPAWGPRRKTCSAAQSDGVFRFHAAQGEATAWEAERQFTGSPVKDDPKNQLHAIFQLLKRRAPFRKHSRKPLGNARVRMHPLNALKIIYQFFKPFQTPKSAWCAGPAVCIFRTPWVGGPR